MEKGIILNGTSSIAVAKQDDLIYRLKPIEEVIALNLGGFKANIPLLFEVNQQSKQAYKAIGWFGDLSSDDDMDYRSPTYSIETIPLNGKFQIIENGKIVHQRFLSATTNLHDDGLFYLFPGQHLQVSMDKDATKVTLFCHPVLLTDSIILPLVP